MEENKNISVLNKEGIINGAIKVRILDINEVGVLIDARSDFLPNAIVDLSLVLTEQATKVAGVIREIKQGAELKLSS